MRMQVWSLTLLSELRVQWCHELWCKLQTRLRSRIAVAVVYAGSYSSNVTPSLGTSIWCRCDLKKKKKKKDLKKKRKKKKKKTNKKKKTTKKERKPMKNIIIMKVTFDAKLSCLLGLRVFPYDFNVIAISWVIQRQMSTWSLHSNTYWLVQNYAMYLLGPVFIFPGVSDWLTGFFKQVTSEPN